MKWCETVGGWWMSRPVTTFPSQVSLRCKQQWRRHSSGEKSHFMSWIRDSNECRTVKDNKSRMRCWGPRMRSAGRKNEPEGKRLKKLKKVEDDEDCKQVDSNWRLLFGCATIFFNFFPSNEWKFKTWGEPSAKWIHLYFDLQMSLLSGFGVVYFLWVTTMELWAWKYEKCNAKRREGRQRDGFMSVQCWAADFRSSWKWRR